LSDRPLGRAFAAARAQGRAALIPYVTAGYPSPAAWRDLVRLAETSGADVVEVGVPFSDPLADGPTIQHSTHAALQQGITVERVLELVRDAGLCVPVVLMTYLNPVLAYGLERFLAHAAAVGVAGVICTDLPGGVDAGIEAAMAASPLDRIPLVAPTTPDARLATVLARGAGFVYLIARLGVTGARSDAPPDLERQVRRVRAVTRLPVAVGFGIATPAQAAAAARWTDGVVVGSALLDAVDRGGVAAGGALLEAMAGALRVRGAA
jgi:tryptophan synthase alpha chain